MYDSGLEGELALAASAILDHVEVGLHRLPSEERGAAALKLAARLAEFAAFEVATTERGGHSPRLILMSAEMDRMFGSINTGPEV